DGLLFGALVSSATYVTVRLRAWSLKRSKIVPSQVASDNPGFRGVEGGVGGERIFEDWWTESGAEAALKDGSVTIEEAKLMYLEFRKTKGNLSPLGCFQGSNEGCVFGWKYSPKGTTIERFANYIVEGYGGPHDALND